MEKLVFRFKIDSNLKENTTNQIEHISKNAQIEITIGHVCSSMFINSQRPNWVVNLQWTLQVRETLSKKVNKNIKCKTVFQVNGNEFQID